MTAIHQADHSRTTIRHFREGVSDPATFGVPPAAPLLTSTIITTESLKGASGIKESDLSKANRLPGGRRETSLTGGGDINVECLFCDELDAFLEDALCEEWSDPYGISANTHISASSVDNSILDESVAGGLFDGIPVGVWIKMSAWVPSANNGWAYVSSKPSDVKLILSYIVLTTRAVGDPVTIGGSYLRDGVKLITRAFERDHEDFSSTRYQAYLGQYCNVMELTFTFEEIIKGKFTYLGRGPEAASATSIGTGDPTPGTPAVQLMDVSNNMRAFRSGGALDGNIKSLTITLNNGGELLTLAQTKYPAGISMGTASLSGTLEGYLVDGGGRQVKAFARTPDSYHFQVTDDLGKTYIFTLWRVLYDDKGDVGKSAKTGPVMLSLPWKAEEDPVIGHWFQVCRFD